MSDVCFYLVEKEHLDENLMFEDEDKAVAKALGAEDKDYAVLFLVEEVDLEKWVLCEKCGAAYEKDAIGCLDCFMKEAENW